MTKTIRPSAYTPTRAIIDIGSNTVRLVIYGGPARAPDVLHNEKITARLGKGVAENGKLGGRATAAALASLARYRTLLDLKGITAIDVVATAAARDAANGPEFLQKIRALGLLPRLLSGEEEAGNSQQNKMKTCNEEAGKKALKGDVRKKFMSECLKG